MIVVDKIQVIQTSIKVMHGKEIGNDYLSSCFQMEEISIYEIF